MNESGDSSPRLLTRAEVAAIFHVSPSTVTRWAEAGKLPVIKTLGGHRRYDAGVVRALVRQASPPPPDNIEPPSVTCQETQMTQTVIDVPAMYGDHHVLEVRRILLNLPGVESVNASSYFKTVAVTFDPAEISPAELTNRLGQAGYLNPLPTPEETELAVTQLPEAERESVFRHTTAYAQAKDVVSFAHSGRRPHLQPALWPCPGLGPIAANGQEASNA